MLQVRGGLDLAEEPLGADDGGEFGAEDLDGDLAVVLEVMREVDGGHAALAELALKAVAVSEGRGEPRAGAAHGFTFAFSSSNQFSTSKKVRSAASARRTTRAMRKRWSSSERSNGV